MNPSTSAFVLSRLVLIDAQATVGTTIFNLLSGWIRARDVQRLASCRDYLPDALSMSEYKLALQIEAFFKKNVSFANDAICEKAARDAFTQGETRCRITNRRLTHYYLNPDRLDPALSRYIVRSQNFINRVLGEYRTFVEAIPHYVRFTTGATADSTRANSSPVSKVTMRPRGTKLAQPYVEALYQFFGYGRPHYRVQEYNRVEWVPKNWKTHRTIACEPMANLPLQLAFGDYVRDRLRKFGVDLRDQSLNQRLACQGSIDGSFATIDLSMASDTVSYNTVAWLLPCDWFKYLNDVRSPLGHEHGNVIPYAKFSSMGNGATFAIESLLFASFCYAVGSSDHRVYGDDIVIRTQYVGELFRVLKFFGFVVNTEKTFTSGPFRESCGGNFYNGIDITPFYLKTEQGSITSLHHLINSLVEISIPYGEVWKYCRELTLASKLLLVPHNEDTRSGVWITPRKAYELRILTTKRSIARFRAFKAYQPSKTVRDIRSLFLWFFQRSKDRIREVPPFILIAKYGWIEGANLPVEQSEAGIVSGIVRYRKTRVYYHSAVAIVSSTVYLWSNYLLASASR